MKDEQSDIEWLFSKLSEHTAIRYRLIPSYSGFERWIVWTGISAFLLSTISGDFHPRFRSSVRHNHLDQSKPSSFGSVGWHCSCYKCDVTPVSVHYVIRQCGA